MDWFKEIKFDGFVYVSSKFIMSIAFVVILCLAVISLNYSKFSGKSYYYSECPTNLMTGKCVNKYYNSNLCNDGTILKQNLPYGDKLCFTEYMFPGEKIGEKEPWLVSNFSFIGGLILFVALLINTFVYNKGFFNFLKDKVSGN